MKRATRLMSIILVVVLFALLAVGCGSGSANSSTTPAESSGTNKDSSSESNKVTDNCNTVTDNRSTITDNRTQSSSTTFSDEDFEVTGFPFENSIGNSLFFVIVKNNSEAVVTVDGNATAKDSGGNPLGADSMSIDVLGPGETSVGYFYFNNVSGVEAVDYQLSYSRQTYYQPVIANLDVSQVLNDKNVTVTVTNNGEINAQFVEAHALFFDASDKVISYNSTYITDSDSEIKPGATLSAQLDLYGKSYDHVDVYFTGRSDGRRTEVSNIVSDADFEVTEHKFENSIGDTLWFLVVKNNSQYDVGVSANSTAYDKAGNVIGADDASIDVLGAGQTSICYFYFDGVKDIDNVQYQFFYKTDLYYEDVLHDLTANTTINNQNVIVAVTNNGAGPAEFVEAHALFYDTQGNVVGYDSTYLTDNDNEIKSGATITKQLDTYTAFSTVEVFFTGRRSSW